MNHLLQLVKSEASVMPHVLGGPAVQTLCGSSGLHDADVELALNELARNHGWRAYSGPHCESLIEDLTASHGHLECRLCSSGTAAVELALRGLGVTAGDEVMLSAYDFRGNFGNICHLDASPVLVDVHSSGGRINETLLNESWSPKVKAIIVSHLHGECAKMPEIREWADQHQIAIVEDACQSPGADLSGRPAGAWGDVATLSFGGSKLISAGRGGAVLTSRPDVTQRMKLAAVRGNDAYPLSEVQAALIRPQWKRLPEENRKRTRAAKLLVQLLRETGQRCLDPWIDEPSGSLGLYKLGMHYRGDACPLTREQFTHLAQLEGIPLTPGFRALHLSHARRRFRAVGTLPNATRLDQTVITLHHTALETSDENIARMSGRLLKLQRFAADLTSAPCPVDQLRQDPLSG